MVHLIWVHLEDPVPLIRASKRVRAMSKDARWQAEWFTHRYERYLVIFEAIARPKLFTVELLESLVRRGALLSRMLVQLIQLLWSATARDLTTERDESIRWGRVSPRAYEESALERIRLSCSMLTSL